MATRRCSSVEAARPVGRLQPGELGIVDERAEEEAGVAVGAEAAVAQMLLEGFGRARHSGCLRRRRPLEHARLTRGTSHLRHFVHRRHGID